jgi:hypothetical protein
MGPAEKPAFIVCVAATRDGVANPARAFIWRSTNKSHGTEDVPELLIPPFVVGAGNDAK